MRYGFDDASEMATRQAGSGDYFTAEQLLSLAWRVAGATMAAIGVPRAELADYGAIVEPTIHEIVREYGVTIPEGYRR
jgi:hypothetical protein